MLPLYTVERTSMRPRTIIVDDDAASAAVVARLLGSLGCETIVCTAPEEAVLLALDDGVDLVSLDLTMPGLDGYQVLTLIRSHELSRRVPSVPVVTITGRVTPVDKADALALGFAAHLAKPIALEDLREALARALLLRGDLQRTRYTADREAIEDSARTLVAQTAGRPLEVVAGLALAVEQQGRDLLRRLLLLALSGNAQAAREPLGRLVDLARAIGASGLQACCEAIDAQVGLAGSGLDTAAALARAELDRVLYTLRELVLH